MTSVEFIKAQYMKAGDTLPNVRAKLYRDGDPFNLDGYTVDMKMKKAEADSLTVDTQIAVDDSSRGIVEYDWSNSDTDTVGTYEVEFVADDGTDTMTFPNSGYANIYIQDGL